MSYNSSGYCIRTYKNGDEEEIVKLFNEVYNGYAGFVPRTAEFWLWCCKNRPGVREDRIILADNGEHVIGYAVVSDAGEVLEFCYNPEKAGEEIVLRLMETIESQLRNVGATSVILNAPSDDPTIREACLKLGYFESLPTYAFQLSIVDLAKFLESILLPKLEMVKGHFSGEILLKIKQLSQIDYDYIVLKILNSRLLIEKNRSESPSFTIETDKRTFASCIFGTRNLLTGILSGKIKVSPLWKVSHALTFLSLLKIEQPWYVPLGDYG